MQSGTLRHRITFQAPRPATDPFQGASQAVWANVVSCWARIEPFTQQDSFGNDQQTMKCTHKVTIRYPGKQNKIGAGYQIVYGSRVFSIVKGIANEDERNRQLVLLVWEMNQIAGG